MLASSSKAPSGAVVGIAKQPEFVKQAFGEQGFGISDVISPAGGGQTVQFAQGFTAADGSRRAVVTGLDPLFLGTFLGAYLNKTKQLEGGESYITDSKATVIAATSSDAHAGESLPNAALQDDALAKEEGEYGSRHFASVSVEGTPWRVIETAPSSVLLASVQGSNKWVPWVIFTAFALAAIAALAAAAPRAAATPPRIKEANERLAESNAELEHRAQELLRSNEELEQFASIASHDLRSRCARSRCSPKQLQETEARQRSRTRAGTTSRRMTDAAERMQTLIEDLLEFSRVTTQGRPFVDVDLNEIVRGVLADLETVIKESGGRVEVGELPSIAGRSAADAPAAPEPDLERASSSAARTSPPVVRIDGDGRQGQRRDRGHRQRHRLRAALRAAHLPRLRAPARPRRVPGHRHRPRALPQDRRAPRRRRSPPRARPGEGATFTVTLPVKQTRRAQPPAANGDRRPADDATEPSMSADGTPDHDPDGRRRRGGPRS